MASVPKPSGRQGRAHVRRYAGRRGPELTFLKDRAGLRADVAEYEQELRQLGEDDDLDARFRRGVTLWKLGESLFRLNEYGRAAVCLEQAYMVLWHIGSHRYVAVLAAARHAEALMQAGKLEEALHSLEVVLGLGVEVPEFPDLLTCSEGERMLLLEELGRKSEAYAYAEALIRSLGRGESPAQKLVVAMALGIIGRSEWAKGDLGVAIRAFKASCEICSSQANALLDYAYADALFSCARLYEESGQNELALSALQELLAKFTGSNDERVIGRLKEAKRLRKKVARPRFGWVMW